MTAHALLISSIRALTFFIEEISISEENAERLLKFGQVLATDLANRLKEKGMSFREA